MITGELTAAIVTLYGGTPPLILIPQGSQVSKGFVMFDVIVKLGADGSGTTQAVDNVSIAGRRDSLAKPGKGTDVCCVPVMVNS